MSWMVIRGCGEKSGGSLTRAVGQVSQETDPTIQGLCAGHLLRSTRENITWGGRGREDSGTEQSKTSVATEPQQEALSYLSPGRYPASGERDNQVPIHRNRQVLDVRYRPREGQSLGYRLHFS